jgi:CRP/FNR family transcriptional regulator, transcriptional activator FtrB
MRSEDVPQIRQIPLFRDISDETFESLLRGAFLQDFPPEIRLFEEGDRADFLPVLLDGVVVLSAGCSGRETVLGLLYPVRTLVTPASVLDCPHLTSARTLVKSRIALIPCQNVRQILASDGAFAKAILEELAGGYRGAIRQITNLKLRTGAERLANLILNQSELEGGRSDFELPVGKRLLASLLGMSPENLSRAFAAIRGHGVSMKGSRVRVTSAPQLRRYARRSELLDRDDWTR